MARAAAVVTALKERGWTIPKALKAVSAEGGLDAKKLKSFRDNINRGLHDWLTKVIYDGHLNAARTEKGLSTDSGLLSLLRD
jgi:hypothetical protein